MSARYFSERTEALVLRSVDYGESDRVLHLLVPEHGRLAAIAKGARRSRKRFPGTLDLFNHLQVQIARRARGASTLARLEQAVLVRQHGALRTHPGRFALGCYLLELLDRLAPEGGTAGDMRRLFRFALDALEALGHHEPGPALRTLLELRAFDALGLRPELRRCVGCGRELAAEAGLGFHVADGGPVCASCGGGRSGVLPVTLGTLRALERGLELDVGKLDRLVLAPGALAEARRLVDRFERFHLGVELRSRRFLERVLSEPV